MNFTDKDKMLARKYITAGYKWVCRNGENLFICKYKPMKLEVGLAKIWLFVTQNCNEANHKRIDKRNFKPVQFSDSEPTKLDDIIGEEK